MEHTININMCFIKSIWINLTRRFLYDFLDENVKPVWRVIFIYYIYQLVYIGGVCDVYLFSFSVLSLFCVSCFQSCQCLWIAHSCQCLWIAHSCQCLWIAHSCQCLWIAHSCQCLWIVHSCQCLWIAHSCQCLWIIHSCQCLWIIHSCQCLWIIHSCLSLRFSLTFNRWQCTNGISTVNQSIAYMTSFWLNWALSLFCFILNFRLTLDFSVLLSIPTDVFLFIPIALLPSTRERGRQKCPLIFSLLLTTLTSSCYKIVRTSLVWSRTFKYDLTPLQSSNSSYIRNKHSYIVMVLRRYYISKYPISR